VPAGLTTFHSPKNDAFRLPLTVTYGPEWDTLVIRNDIDLIYKGDPPNSDTEWWGPSIVLLNGGHVPEAAVVAATTESLPPLGQWQPIPDDLLGYVSSIPGAEVVEGPSSITIGGIQGSQLIIQTPAMHPFLWLKDDTLWHGGGASGVDPELKRLMILLKVNAESVLLEYQESPERFDQHYPLVQDVFNSISFGD
jgi:hypothetical protein